MNIELPRLNFWARAAGLIGVLAVLLPSAVIAGGPAGDPAIASVAAGATAVGAADRGSRSQLEQPPPPPTYAGCLQPRVAAVAAGAPGREWQLATVNGKWRIGFRGQAGPAGAIVVVGDSLTYLSIADTMSALVQAGYGPICVDAGYGRYVAVGTGTSSVSSGLDVIVRVRASAPVWQMDTVRWVVALGTNDVGRTNAGRADWWCAQQIAAARWAIGATRLPPEWINLRTRRVGSQYVENVWNEALPANGFTPIDWSAAVAPAPALFISDDLVHPTVWGTALRLQLLTA